MLEGVFLGRWGLHGDYYRNGFISIPTTIFILRILFTFKDFLL